MRQARKRRGEVKHRRWPLSQRPGFLIRRLHQIHVALFQEACGKFDVTPLQYSLLSALAARKTADQTTLAADIALDRTTTTGALNVTSGLDTQLGGQIAVTNNLTAQAGTDIELTGTVAGQAAGSLTAGQDITGAGSAAFAQAA